MLMLTDTIADAGEFMNNTLSMGERIKLGLEVLLLGMAVVFAVLVVIWAILVLTGKIFLNGAKNNNAKSLPEKAVETTPVSEEITSAETDEAPDETELIAAITAAIAVVLDKPQTSFRVVSFRRTASK